MGGSASAWTALGASADRATALPALLPPEPLAELLEEWQLALNANCAAGKALMERYTLCGDLEGLHRLQSAVLALMACPALFGCGPYIRDRLSSTYCGVS